MKVKFSPWLFAIAFCLIVCARVSDAQSCPAGVTGPNCVQVFSAVNVRDSQSAATYAAPNYFNTSNLSLTCNTSPIVASLSGPLMNGGGTAPQLSGPPANALQAGGNLVVDNNLLVAINGGTPADVCTGFNQGTSYNNLPVPPGLAENCFQGAYATAIGYPTDPSPLNGDDPDTTPGIGGPQTVDAVGGVGPIDISTLLSGGSQKVTITEVDDGGFLTASSMFLATNCTVTGVSGPANISGNTITGTSGLTQTANFNTVTGQQVGFVYDVSGVSVFSANANGSIPDFGDAPLDPSQFQQYYVPSTSFATSNCLVHTGELLPNNNPACKLYTLTCTIGTGNQATGAQCPVSDVENEVIKDIFDGPAFTLQNIYTPYGFLHEGIGLLMASDTWGGNTLPPAIPTNGGPCTFDTASGLESLPCPQNLLTSFSGPGGFGGVGQTTNPNSTFISVYGVPEDLTSVYVAGEWPDNWVNTSTPKVSFYTQSPNFTKGASIQQGNNLVALPNYKNYIPTPIQSVTYGISPAGSVPSPVSVPISTDTQLVNPLVASGCPLPTTSSPKSVPNFVPAVQTLATLPDGQYLLHYYAEDCAGTRELLFTTSPSNQGPSWSTNFYTYPINIDTQKPTIKLAGNSQLVQGGTYSKGAAVNAIYSCTDPNTVVANLNTGSGVVLCGSNIYAPQSTYNTGSLTTKVNTSTKGPSQTFTAYAIDGAGNMSTLTVTYSVH